MCDELLLRNSPRLHEECKVRVGGPPWPIYSTVAWSQPEGAGATPSYSPPLRPSLPPALREARGLRLLISLPGALILLSAAHPMKRARGYTACSAGTDAVGRNDAHLPDRAKSFGPR